MSMTRDDLRLALKPTKPVTLDQVVSVHEMIDKARFPAKRIQRHGGWLMSGRISISSERATRPKRGNRRSRTKGASTTPKSYYRGAPKVLGRKPKAQPAAPYKGGDVLEHYSGRKKMPMPRVKETPGKAAARYEARRNKLRSAAEAAQEAATKTPGRRRKQYEREMKAAARERARSEALNDADLTVRAQRARAAVMATRIPGRDRQAMLEQIAARRDRRRKNKLGLTEQYRGGDGERQTLLNTYMSMPYTALNGKQHDSLADWIDQYIERRAGRQTDVDRATAEEIGSKAREQTVAHFLRGDAPDNVLEALRSGDSRAIQTEMARYFAGRIKGRMGSYREQRRARGMSADPSKAEVAAGRRRVIESLDAQEDGLGWLTSNEGRDWLSNQDVDNQVLARITAAVNSKSVRSERVKRMIEQAVVDSLPGGVDVKVIDPATRREVTQRVSVQDAIRGEAINSLSPQGKRVQIKALPRNESLALAGDALGMSDEAMAEMMGKDLTAFRRIKSQARRNVQERLMGLGIAQIANQRLEEAERAGLPPSPYDQWLSFRSEQDQTVQQMFREIEARAGIGMASLFLEEARNGRLSRGDIANIRQRLRNGTFR